MNIFKQLKLPLIVGGLLASLHATQVSASNQALIIGITEHQNPYLRYDHGMLNSHGLNLPGIAIDIENATTMATLMGIPANNIQTLNGPQATHDNIVRALRILADRATSPDDKVMIYYSGHGAQIKDDNGDEPDGYDEVLIPYDTTLEVASASRHDITLGNGTYLNLKNSLRDDELGRLLGKIKSENVYVLMDACQSGSSTKSIFIAPSGSLEATPKYAFDSPGANPRDGSWTDREYTGTKGADIRQNKSGPNHLLLSAATDSQLANASPNGSFFTNALVRVLKDASDNETTISWQKTQHDVQNYINNLSANSGKLPHTAVLSGSEALINKPVPLVQEAQSNYWNFLQQMTASANTFGSLKVQTNKEKNYKIDEEVILSITVPKEADGAYLTVLMVDAKDRVDQLFPNRFHPQETKVKAGTLQIGGQGQGFDIVAAPPSGATMLYVVLTSEPLNLYKSAQFSIEQLKDVKQFVFARLEGEMKSGMKGARTRGRSEQVWLDYKVIDVD